ncbi:SHOCT domain-containing protein [Yinghuangia soli]|uniref:SHOCT domain-containing protein n=1 Tax=Yinghuangia soli TaxID=2908204 RepID=A0AA41U017_9ACTN|nr:SHOCT domain-containing protein [Yinghuangia soli]MCF2525962.1 SHOCT domain-containing protein [Yinghuangia soli]
MMRRGPGLLGAAARTAVVAGTATAVSGRVRQRQADRRAEQDAAAQYEAQQQAQAYAPPPAAPAAPAQDSVVDQLERLAALRSQGILSDAEFDAQKARILAGG